MVRSGYDIYFIVAAKNPYFFLHISSTKENGTATYLQKHVLLLIQAKSSKLFPDCRVFLSIIRTICSHNGKKRKFQKCVFPCGGFAATGDRITAGTGAAGASSTAVAGTEQRLKLLPCLDQSLFMVPGTHLRNIWQWQKF
jgi:hypothetical protein